VSKPLAGRVRARAAGFLEHVVTDIRTALVTDITKPKMLFTFGIAAVIVVTSWSAGIGASVIGEFLTKHNTNPVCKWILDNSTKFLGALMLYPPAYFASGDLQIVAIGAATIGVFVLTEKHLYEYLFQGVALHLFTRCRRPTTQATIFAAVVAVYWLQMLPVPIIGIDSGGGVTKTD
jgi:hypothetical protein